MERLAADISEDQALAANVINILATALLTASLKWGLHLDFSEASVEGLDSLLERLHQPFQDGSGPAPVDEQVASQATLWGVYLGEVIRRNRGGRWSYRELPESKRALQIGFGDQGIFPISRVTRQIRGGAEFSVRAFYNWTAGFSAPAGAAVPASAEIVQFARAVGEIALELIRARSNMSPCLAFTKDGKINFEGYATTATDQSIAMARKRAAQQPAEVEFAAVAYDGYVSHQNEKKRDAILIEAHQRGLPTGFIFGQCYARQTDGKAVRSGELEEVSTCPAFLT
jgi:hypothetical protein